MSAEAAPLRASARDTDPLDLTLLELVDAISEVASDDCEVVATVTHLLRSGRVRLLGNFRGTAPDELG